jgi:hypothetical protein
MPACQQLSALRDYQCFVPHRQKRGCRVMASAVNGPPTRDTSIDILPPRMQRYLRIALPRLHAVRPERAHHGARPLCAGSDHSLKTHSNAMSDAYTHEALRKLAAEYVVGAVDIEARSNGINQSKSPQFSRADRFFACENPAPPGCPKCNKPMRFMLVKTGGRRFRCIDCDVPDPINSPEVTKLLTGELAPPE